MRPKLQKLHSLLEDRLYKGPMYEADHDDDEEDPKLYSLQDIKSRIQASEEEIMTELQKIKACCVNGKICRKTNLQLLRLFLFKQVLSSQVDKYDLVSDYFVDENIS